ncbi:B3 domain-containing protein Os11g0197600-like [Selaginella moellendorffii]|uniref:B3 domain-containing protein Os11g0197600-like n=1 Tax=Selaginella moellendorffii TaxID=88036 RepID=UPI000D1CE28C|nr:B3 domain-containing protein Os11g0197600-like [Selaginella moellendorffii]|eukprot:XP_024536571.1 B3 domain-containing protein Os11g0197600-like [Selaginella moellendorffii]
MEISSSSGSQTQNLPLPDIEKNDSDYSLPPPIKSKQQQQLTACVPWGKRVEELPGFLEAMTAAKERQTRLGPDEKSRSFLKVMCKTSANGWIMGFPLKFSRKYMPQRRAELTILDESGDSWPVKWVWTPGLMHPSINAGWKLFSTSHGLERGDVCLFHLHNAKSLAFKVYIFKRQRRGSKRKHQQQQQQQRGRIGFNTADVIPDSEEEEGYEQEEDDGASFEELEDITGTTEIKLSVSQANPWERASMSGRQRL